VNAVVKAISLLTNLNVSLICLITKLSEKVQLILIISIILTLWHDSWTKRNQTSRENF